MDKNNSMKKLLSLFEEYLLNNLPTSKTFHPYFEIDLTYHLYLSFLNQFHQTWSLPTNSFVINSILFLSSTKTTIGL